MTMKSATEEAQQDEDPAANSALIEKLQEAEWWILQWTGSDHIPNTTCFILCWYALVENQTQDVRNFCT